MASIQNVNVWAKAGVMIRETLDANSKHAMVLFSATREPIYERRVATAGLTTSTNTTGNPPGWVRLVRARVAASPATSRPTGPTGRRSRR